MKVERTDEDLINWWMVPCYGITIEKAYELKPWTDSRDFYTRYRVTQKQHDEWYEKVVTTYMKERRWSRKMTMKQLAFVYLNTAPAVIQQT